MSEVSPAAGTHLCARHLCSQDGEEMTARFSYSWSDEENNLEDPATHLITTTLAIESLSAAASGQQLDVTPPTPPVGYTPTFSVVICIRLGPSSRLLYVHIYTYIYREMNICVYMFIYICIYIQKYTYIYDNQHTHRHPCPHFSHHRYVRPAVASHAGGAARWVHPNPTPPRVQALKLRT